jgi:hypothetical protein
MAYKFGRQAPPETLDHVPLFKKAIDELVLKSASVVSIGWRYDTGYAFYEFLLSKGRSVTMIEIFPPNYEAFVCPGIKKVCADVRTYRDHVPSNHRGCLVWQDGPEHLPLSEAKSLLSQMQSDFESIILATPNGPHAQGSYLGNPAECHLSTWHKDTYGELGFASVEYLPQSAGLIGYWVNRSPDHSVGRPGE